MARTARIVIPDTPHHVTQRGNRGEPVFFEKTDYETYKALLAEQCTRHGVSVWCYCLMAGQVHLIAVPRTAEALGLAIGEAHRRYTRYINEKQGWRGHLFQDRFASCALDEQSLLVSARMIETLPVFTGIAQKPESYLWSSARAHIRGREDILVMDNILPQLVPDWTEFLQNLTLPEETKAIATHLQTGRPRGSENFLNDIEKSLGRSVRPGKPGRKAKR